MLIEQVTGKPIPTVFAERIYKPLGLKQTSWAKGGAMPAPYARGFTVQTLDGKRADATNRDPSWAFTAGELSLRDVLILRQQVLDARLTHLDQRLKAAAASVRAGALR